jgi:two-component system, cell cycle sensor histidine kinase and response regulator CckA
VLSVKDSGIGMSKEVLAHLFEPFFTTKAVGQGTGLGLASVHGMAHQHGGWIEARSELGQGSQFDLYLPIDENSNAPALPLATKPTPAASVENSEKANSEPAITVLLVEDEQAVRTSIERMLIAQSFKVLSAANADQARSTWHASRPQVDVLLTDLVMPGDSGIELAKQLRQEQADLPVLLMSGYVFEALLDHQRESIQAGQIEFLSKPFEAKELRARITAMTA